MEDNEEEENDDNYPMFPLILFKEEEDTRWI